MELPGKINVKIDYEKCQPKGCHPAGRCAVVDACPKKIVCQEASGEYPYFHPANYCRGCIKCAEAYPLKAVEKVQLHYLYGSDIMLRIMTVIRSI